MTADPGERLELVASGSPDKERRMLVLSRRKGQKLKINDDITIVVNWIRGDKVSLAISAPPEVSVVRAEIDDKPTGESV